MLKHLLNDRVVDQVDPVEFWETELDGRLSRTQFGPIREIAQSIVEAVDRLSDGQGEDPELDADREALRKAMSEPNKAHILDAAIRTAFKRGGVL